MRRCLVFTKRAIETDTGPSIRALDLNRKCPEFDEAARALWLCHKRPGAWGAVNECAIFERRHAMTSLRRSIEAR
jgi:hypothetical protein